MEKYDVVIRGAYGAYNFGDDALLDVVYTNLTNKFPELNIAIWGSQTSYLKKCYPKATILKKTDLTDTECEHLIYGGGTQFYDFGQKRKLKDILYLLKNPTYLWFKITNKKTSYLNAKNEYYLCCGLGPFLKDSKIKANALLRMSESPFLYLRDMKSIDYCNEAGINADITVDMCFSKSLKYKKKKNGRVAVVLRDWNFTDSKYTISELYDDIVSINNYDVDIITFGDDEKTKIFASENNMNLVTWDPESMSINDFISILSSYNIIISSRYHGVIYSILLNIPVIALPIENKLEQAAKELDGVVLGDLSVNDINYYINIIDSDFEALKNKLENTRENNFRIATDTMDKLTRIIGDNK
ncbi:polysaccharide pyruvyl transferase family protein [Vibrio kanaloae]|uniref:polysaccharide pyruvyl transferase family protein n=1 Tax=Vibrio kanaloae TaxID=170673 RepID=UPI000988B61E|nr:polysaccharide pyruvyl transferase family protein [Vibrio kanaloae]QPK05349.1 polysaccharide pyruvyl transferase family protein [Vibrio kanaloae]